MKKWIALCLAVIMALSLCACGKDSGKKTDDPTTAPTTPAKPTDPTQDPGSNDPGNPEKPEAGNFDLLIDMVNCYYDGMAQIEQKIELIYDEDFSVTGVKVYKNDRLEMEITYDKETSNILSKQAYKEDGSRGSKSEYTYDEQGNELTYIATLSDGTVDFYREYTYNAQGQLESNTYGWGEQSPQYRDVFTYDNHGNKLSQVMYVSGEYDSEITYENRYENDKLVEIKTYHDGILRWDEKYDADGLLIAEDQYTYEGEVFSTTTYTYENGKILLRIVSNEGAESFRQEYTYTDDGQLAEVAYFDQGSFCGRDVYTYENGSLVKVEMYDHQELENQYILTYKKANVTEEQAEKLTALYETILEF